MQTDKTWLEEWRRTGAAYRRGDARTRLRMRRRALYFASLTIHTPWRESYRRWQEGLRPALPAAITFWHRRKGLHAGQWVPLNRRYDAKSQFARALLGFDNAACFDTWINRTFGLMKKKQWHGSTQWQWAHWFRIYGQVYRDQQGTIIPQHCNVLRWIRTGTKHREYVQETFWKGGQL